MDQFQKISIQISEQSRKIRSFLVQGHMMTRQMKQIDKESFVQFIKVYSLYCTTFNPYVRGIHQPWTILSNVLSNYFDNLYLISPHRRSQNYDVANKSSWSKVRWTILLFLMKYLPIKHLPLDYDINETISSDFSFTTLWTQTHFSMIEDSFQNLVTNDTAWAFFSLTISISSNDSFIIAHCSKILW